MFGETRNHPVGDFDRLLEERGGDNNAATWNDWTFYRTSLPAGDLELAVSLDADRMTNLVLDDDQIETEREVVVNERKERVDDDVDGFLDENLTALAYTVHPYRWPTIGWMEDIRALHKDVIHAFYRTYYTPNNATLVVCGDFAEQAALELVERHYGAIPAAEIPAEDVASEPPQDGERSRRFTKPVTADRVVVGYKVPGQNHPDWAVLDFIAQILAGGPSARLLRRLIVEREIATSVDCGAPPFRDPCLFRVGVNMARGYPAREAIAELDGFIAELASGAVDDDELTKVKNCIETDFWSSMEDCDGKAESARPLRDHGGRLPDAVHAGRAPGSRPPPRTSPG